MHSNRTVQYYWDLIITLTKKELKVKYKRNFLGYLWSVANPLALALVFFIAFKIVLRIPIENYTLFLISGLFPWQWFSNSVNSSTMVFIGNASLIKKVNFRWEALVVAMVLNDMVHFLFSIPVIILFLFYYGLTPHMSWIIGIPLLIMVQFMITFGFSLAIAALNLFFRDMERIVFIVTTLLLYLTPILYSVEMVPEKYRAMIMLNPLSTLMLSWRNIFMTGTIHVETIAVSFVFAFLGLFSGFLIFRSLRWKFAEVL